MGKRALFNNAFLCVTLIFTACATPKPVANFQRDAGYTKKLDRVLVVSVNAHLVDDNVRHHFSTSATAQVLALLAKRGVEGQVLTPKSNEAESGDELLQAMIRFEPHQILYFGPSRVQNEIVMSRGWNTHVLHNDVAKLAFGTKLVDVRMHRTVWHGEMSYWFEPEPTDVAQFLVDRLAADNLLPAAQ